MRNQKVSLFIFREYCFITLRKSRFASLFKNFEPSTGICHGYNEVGKQLLLRYWERGECSISLEKPRDDLQTLLKVTAV